MDNRVFHLLIGFLSLFSCLIIIIPFWLNRKHYLISYYGFKVNFFVAITVTISMFLISLCYAFDIPCIVSTVITTVGACVPIALQCGRYIGLILMNKVNVLKTQIITFERKKSTQTNNEESGETSSNYTYSNLKSYQSMESNKDMNIEKSIEKKYLIPIFIVYGVIIFSSFVMCLILNKDILFEKCIQSSWKLFIPVLSCTGVLTIFLPYIIINTFKNLTNEKKADIMIYLFFTVLSGTLFMLCKFDIIKSNNSSYFFYFAHYSNVLLICIPLYNIHKVKNKVNKKSSKEDFIRLLFDKKFVMLLKEQSIHLYCVENVLFWEMHLILMNIVFDNYSASKSEKRRNRIIQKKTSTTRIELIGLHNKSGMYGSKSIVDNERKSSIIDLENVQEKESLDSINIVVDREKDDASIITKNSMSSQFKGTKQDLYEMVVVNFINEKNIIFYNDEQESNNDISSKVGLIYDILFKEYCQANNIKLTKKEQLIDSFLIENQLKKYFQKVYDIFIDPKGISPLNISNTIIEDVKNTINRPTYSHKIFKQVIEEVINMMYFNVYLNSLKKLTV